MILSVFEEVFFSTQIKRVHKFAGVRFIFRDLFRYSEYLNIQLYSVQILLLIYNRNIFTILKSIDMNLIHAMYF